MKTSFDHNISIYFLHIPKTAGSSMIMTLVNAFPSEDVLRVGHWDYIVRTPTEQLSRCRIFMGHYSAYLNRFLGRKLNVFTFFRDPVERTLSHYSYIRLNPTHPYYEIACRQTLREFVTDPVTRTNVVNYQARYIADLGYDPRYLLPIFADCDPARTELQMKIDDQSLAVPEETLRRAALRALDSFFFVSTTENFARAIDCLGEQIGVNLGKPIRTNVTEKRVLREEVDPETLEIIHESTKIDREIYELIRSREAEIESTAKATPLRAGAL
jgi:hypothetical protein